MKLLRDVLVGASGLVAVSVVAFFVWGVVWWVLWDVVPDRRRRREEAARREGAAE